ncbi:related to Tripeptidyl-peptidase sed1 [Lecanosticta acicola]|uniref:tripeptidyl-peptidase II n=1 Tax=Lecanosticta acicola TaxID=111012 RepID=A0AAI8YYH4_9PEZI|nr:related to Tripeptidyl-peptidase sed1 [Lecanosticta acicola]
MHLTGCAVVWSLAASALALSTPSNLVSHEKRTQSLKQWVKRGDVHRRAILPMRIGLKQSNIDNGRAHALLDDISHPDSPNFGQWLSAEQVHDLFAPAPDAVDAVRAWLHDADISPARISQSTNRQWIQFDATAAEAERLFKTKYHHYEHLPTGSKHVACDEYFLPDHVSRHVDYVTPGLKLLGGGRASNGRPLDGRKRGRGMDKRGFRTAPNQNFSTPPIIGPLPIPPTVLNATKQFELANCDSYITPPCIAAMYNITQATKAAPGNELGIFEEGDFYGPADLALFFATLAPNIPVTTMPKLEGVDGGFAPGAYAGGESDLDFQISYPIIYPQNEILFQTDDIFYATGIEGGGGFLNTFLDAIDGSYCNYSAYGETGDASIDPKYPDPILLGYQGQRQCGVYKPTNVISISYGEQEDDLPTNYQQRQCNEFMKLGMMGTSVIIASGDSGVAARGTDDNNADGCLGHGEVFNPDFPASCPYVTAAGATYLPPGGDPYKDQEVAVTRFPSGGGFSNIYPRPAYQNASVTNYLTAHTPSYPTYNTSGMNNPPESVTNGGLYNIAGRGYPDVSAIGDNVVVVVNGMFELIGGTSAAAPTFAAIINRVNEERIAAGKKPVGFLNPTLYAHPEIFHDITVGNNSGCGTPGFYAAPGWDPVTGLGTPNYPAILSQFMSMP